MKKDTKLFNACYHEFNRRFQKHKGKYDYCDFAFELFKEKDRMKKSFLKHDQWRDKIEFGI